MAFFQTPPVLGNQYTSDHALRSYLSRALPPDVMREIEPELDEMGELAGGFFRELDAVGQGRRAAARAVGRLGQPRRPHRGHAALGGAPRASPPRRASSRTAYEQRHGELSRIHQFALVYLFDASTDVYTCPLAMTDGAAKTLLVHGNRALIDRAVPRLTSRDPKTAWTSGQWMTERTGGSDVAMTETVAQEGRRRLAPLRHQVVHQRRPPRRWRSPSRGPRAIRPAGAASRSSTSRCATTRACSATSRSIA